MLLKEIKTTEWGQPVTMQRYLLETIIGDGKVLLYIGNTDQRPSYWLAWVDSSIKKMDDTSFEFEDYIYNVVLEKIYDECGCFDYEENKEFDDLKNIEWVDNFPEWKKQTDGEHFGIEDDEETIQECKFYKKKLMQKILKSIKTKF
jgi:hypothetical protein